MRTLLAILFLLAMRHCLFGQGTSASDSVNFKSSPAQQDSLSKKELHKIDSATTAINSKIDSLQGKGLPTAFYQKKLDSIHNKVGDQLSLARVSGKINGDAALVISKLNAPLDKAQKKAKENELALQNKIKRKTTSLDSLTSNAGNVNLQSSKVANPNLPNQNIPDINLPNTSVNTPGVNLQSQTNELSKLDKDLTLPQSQELNRLKNETKQLESIPKQELKSTGITKEANEISKDAKEVGTIKGQADGYKNEIKQIKEGDSTRVKGLEKDAEKSAQNSAEFKELNKETKAIQSQKNALEQYQDMLSKLKKDNGLTDVKDFSTKEIKNPFEGQEQKLQAGIAQLDKLKKKYHIVPDSRYLPKHVPNEMKGKPWKERLISGLSFQTYQGSNVGVDLSAYLMYRLTGRLRVGVGTGNRFSINTKRTDVSTGDVQMIRAMADFRLLPMLNLHAEEEWTHYGANAQMVNQKPTDPPLRDWHAKLNIGVLKTYKISKRLDGQVQLLYNTLDLKSFPQSKNTNVRFGFEYKFGVKKRNPVKTSDQK